MGRSAVDGALVMALRSILNAPVASAKAKRPNNLSYGVDDVPPLSIVALNGVQHVGLIAINLVYPLLIFRAVNAPVQVVAELLGIGMIVLAIGTFLQTMRLGPVGSGYMCPATFTATYFAPSLLAAKAGGLPLVAGMTIFAGVLESALAPLLNRLRAIFPPEVSGLVILMIGLSVGLGGVRLVFAPGAPAPTEAEWWVGCLTLATMVALNIWGRGVARMLCALIGLMTGYILAASSGLLDPKLVAAIAGTPWLGFPTLPEFSWSFDVALAVPFAVAAIAAAMKAAGTITVCQRVNDAHWLRPDMHSIMQGVLADGMATAVAGLAGTVGINTSTPAVGVASATGVASRRVSYAAGMIFLLLGFFPKLSAILAIMPRAVIVPSLLFAVSFIIINGLQVIGSRMFDSRRTIIVGMSMTAGLAIEVLPGIADMGPVWARPIIGSSVVFTTVIAVALNLLFRIGVRKKAVLTMERDDVNPEVLESFLEKQGAVWGARPDVIKRAIFGVTQLLDAILDGPWRHGRMSIEATFDEFNLDIRVGYRGVAIAFPAARPSADDILREDGAQLLAGYLLRRNADRVSSVAKGDAASIHFHFEH